MVKRTTLVDRRILTLVVQGIPGLPEEVIERHLKHAALLHEAEAALLRADLTKVDLEALVRLLQPELSNEIRLFVPGTLDRVHTLGGQFAKARITTVPGGETLESQQRDKVIDFSAGRYFPPNKGATRLTVAPSIAGQVVYLPGLVTDSLKCSFDKIEAGRLSVQEILDSLPKVEGLRWIIGNVPTVCRVLANHLKETDKYLLSGVYTWTTDKYGLARRLLRLLVGLFVSYGVDVRGLKPGSWSVNVGLFALGVPS